MAVRDESREWFKIPRAELAKLDSILEREKREFHFVKWLDGGYSGSPVALIRDKLSGRSSTERILKFCSRGKSEVEGIDAAYELAPDEFKKQHLVKASRNFLLNDWCGLLMEIAGGDLSSPSLADYATDERLAEICSNLIGSLLNDWNAGERELSEDLTTGEFLRRAVGVHKIEAEGSLPDFTARAGIAWNEKWIKRPGWEDWLRNPLTMLSKDYGPEISAVVGIGHGDLSIFNVLIPGFPDFQPAAYWLIDYGDASPSHSLTRDPMYLLISLATRWLQDIAPSSDLRRSLIKVLAMSPDRIKPLSVAPYQKVCNEAIKTGHEWAKKKDRGHYWRPQSQLSIIGCALAFIGRKIGSLEVSESDNWLFSLAAVAASEYCKTHERGSMPPQWPPPPYLPESDPPMPTGSILELVEELCSVTFSQEHWTQLELGTRDLRPLLTDNYNIDSNLATSINGLIAELRKVLDGAIGSLASPRQLSTVCRRAEDLRERLLTLLRT